ncbi:hypothetical protein E0L36_15490 [Streptomyces sp. AJS327]|uniref:CoA transferase n=1 Tax=Streptomyces sp. AJS327 TaxID=2545265 RepID=UPI0015DE60B4|nr:CoA transferase [Streptomyces sp. AJS327]MBA0052257.1 hypothetical protein [Streptomyces sp. AJS327]
MEHTSPPAVAGAWDALGGDPALLGRVSRRRRPGLLPARLPVDEVAAASVAACSLAAAEFSCARAGTTGLPEVTVDDAAVAAAFAGERLLRIDGEAPRNWHPLSRFWPAADGWVRTHAQYPHHRERLFRALGLPAGAGPEGLAGALAGRKALEVEETVSAAGGLAVAVRSERAWAAHEQAAAVRDRGLLTLGRLDGAAPPELTGSGGPGGLAGLRVLDLTRVIAGPLTGQVLALFGAEVLRVDPPHLPELPQLHLALGAGKRSALLDLTRRRDQAVFEELLSSAHVVLTGYRPGALDRFGLAPESLADRRPGLVVGQLGAWGCGGPWHRRRGFDSLVQAATGIAELQADPESGEPGALPAQALDHATGYLLAAGVLRSLTEQRTGSSGSRLVRATLARTAHWLTAELPRPSTPAPGPAVPADGPEERLAERDSPSGRLRYARPPVGFTGGPTDWPRPPGSYGADPARWERAG